MKLADFDYHIPAELIAQEPSKDRDHSRLLVVDRKKGTLHESFFYELPDFLKKGDALVINDSKVIPARLWGEKETGGIIEILLLTRRCDSQSIPEVWEVLLKPAKRIRRGTKILFGTNGAATVLEKLAGKKWLLSFATDTAFEQFLHTQGKAPLPPYIKRKKETAKSGYDLERYQTIYARIPGSVAAPTAGLHFSPQVLTALRNRGIGIAPVTLHVGYGTFLPVETDTVEEHVMEEEFFEISQETADIINGAKRVIAVGSTSTRVIESVADENGLVAPFSGSTGLYIYPGYRFRSVHALLTNFHLPKSTLYLLVCGFAGKELIQKAYRYAIENRFRFYSYGDCTLIL
ncbi:MAG: tRNA preQ1(34) S-adenosylmethionine ribosyltransferase-isomerase QueA [Deltaproteobacteria bacterium]|nr:tRNA preQ1(34) S-adenosylmethionine ribosyltransferase-isomerase QueA [Deltaproteobacteria bacterium]